jgi:hypothetical protein
MTLAVSRAAFPKAIWKSSKQVWSELHEEAFAYFGGATCIVRPDNLKEGVLAPDIYDPEINELYASVLAHYGSVAVPCRPYVPDLKGKVESSIGYVQSALRGKRFESLDEHNAYLLHWNERWASTRIHGTTKRQVRAMLEEEIDWVVADQQDAVAMWSAKGNQGIVVLQRRSGRWWWRGAASSTDDMGGTWSPLGLPGNEISSAECSMHSPGPRPHRSFLAMVLLTSRWQRGSRTVFQPSPCPRR